jgi:hypothetical protein
MDCIALSPFLSATAILTRKPEDLFLSLFRRMMNIILFGISFVFVENPH